MKKLIAVFAAILTVLPLADSVPSDGKSDGAAGGELRNHFKFYGFVRNFFAFDTRESVAGTGDLFYYLPKDRLMNEDGSQDLNAQSSFRFLALTSRLGVDVYGYRIGRTSFGAKVETDFYAGLTNKINGTAQLRLRQAYMTIGWDGLRLGKEGKAAVDMKIGQAWHPMAADQPHVLALETGTPFNPFSRTPLVQADASLGDHFVISAAAIWQMQYLSAGPDGASAEYIKYACTPEGYVGLTYRTKGGFLGRIGLDILSIKPRRTGLNNDLVTVRVSDRITTMSPYIYLQYKKGKFEAKAKTVYGAAGEHINLMSGYGISSKSSTDGHWKYYPLHSSSSWFSFSYGKKWQVMFMAGYVKNFGTRDPLFGNKGAFAPDVMVNGKGYVSADNIYFNANGSPNLNDLWRVVPTVAYNFGKFTIAMEWNVTSARYGEYGAAGTDEDAGMLVDASTGLVRDNLHWVTNHRLQMMVRFTF